MPVQDLLSDLRGWIGPLLEEKAGGDRFSWDVSMAIVSPPTPPGAPQMPPMAVWLVFLYMETGIVGSPVAVIANLNMPIVQDGVDKTIGDMVVGLREQRSQMLAMANPGTEMPVVGRRSGLLLPGN